MPLKMLSSPNFNVFVTGKQKINALNEAGASKNAVINIIIMLKIYIILIFVRIVNAYFFYNYSIIK